MKKKLVILPGLLLYTACLLAQTGFTYQAVLRNSDGSLRKNESISILTELVQNNTVVYSETQYITTNAFGAFTMIVGQGSGALEYDPAIFLNTDSTSLYETLLRVKEEGGALLSESIILGVPVAEVAGFALKAHIDFPAGAIIPFGGTTDRIPEGWLLCDGSAISRADYPDLFAAIGTNWGAPDEMYFNVPDLRGVFLRGANGEASDNFSDPNRANRISRLPGGSFGNSVGAFQADELKSHRHAFMINDNSWPDDPYDQREDLEWNSVWNKDEYEYTLYTGGDETRPKNAYVNFIIKL